MRGEKKERIGKQSLPKRFKKKSFDERMDESLSVTNH